TKRSGHWNYYKYYYKVYINLMMVK
ncbi:hypothetical protein PBAL39_17239, partial [Pedobacter sp. BAL39]